MRRLLITLLVLSAALTSSAYRYEVDNIYYNLINQGGKACLSVTFCDSTGNSYVGAVTIPEKVLITIRPTVSSYLDVVQVGPCAFKDCPDLKSVSLPSTIGSIDSCAFQNCSGMSSLDFPTSLRSIGDNAFEGCAALTHVTIPGQVNMFGRDIFKDCIGIQSFELQEDISMIPEGMFKGCSGLTSLCFSNNITNIGSEAFVGCTALEHIELTNVKTIGTQAFSHTGLSSVTITSRLDDIGQEAFSDCGQLDTVNVCAGCVATFARNVFARCDRMEAIVCGTMIPPTVDETLGLSERQLSDVELLVPYSAHARYQQALGWRDFANIIRLNYDFAVTEGREPIYYRIISDDEVSITYKDESYASYNGNYVGTDQDIDMWMDLWSNYSQYRKVGVRIPEFVNFAGKKYWVTEIGDNAFRNSTKLTVLEGFVSKIKRIGKNAFKGCTGLRFVETLDMSSRRLTEIGSNAFEGCTRLHYIEIPPEVTEIGSYAFAGCSGLKMVSFQSPSITVGSHAFTGTSLAGHVLTGDVGISCYNENPPLLCDSTVFDAKHYAKTKVEVLYSSVDRYRTDEYWSRFANYKANCYDFRSGNIYYRINDDGETVSVAPASDVYYASYSGTVSVPERVNYCGKEYVVSRVASMAFALSTCSDVKLPNSIRCIEDFAFYLCQAKRVVLGNGVDTIGKGAFYLSILETIHFPKSVSIAQQALQNTPKLNSISVEDGNPCYDSRDNCNALIETATNRLLAGCGSSIIPSSVVEIADSAFLMNERLNSIVIPENIKTIGTAVFAGCSQLQEVSLPSALTSIGNLAFMYTGLIHVTIPDEVEAIGDQAFIWNSKLRSISIGKGVKTIGKLAFATQNLENSLQSVVCKALTPPEMASSDCFDGGYAKATLFVPASSLALYKNDGNWSQFYQILPLEDAAVEEAESDAATYKGRIKRFNLMGMPVGDDYRGIIIENGRKQLKVGSSN